MQLSFEQEKNIKAGIYTLLICIALSCLFIVMHWQQPAPPMTPPSADFMEVNLGNSNTGQGNVAPLSKEAPSTEIGSKNKVKATSINKSIKINASGNDPNDEAIRSSKDKTNIKNLPLPPAAKPKALMGKYAGGNGQGGNNQDSYNNVKDQGIVGGHGDQGAANGNINSKNYEGNGGPFVTKGDRRITKAYSFNGDVEPATIYAEIEVNTAGVGRFIQIVKGSSSNDAKYKKAIVEYLTKINFNSSDHISNVTVKFKFENQ